jgi:hypothetical protein
VMGRLDYYETTNGVKKELKSDPLLLADRYQELGELIFNCTVELRLKKYFRMIHLKKIYKNTLNIVVN